MRDPILRVSPGSSAAVNIYVNPPAERFKGNTLVVRVYATDLNTGEVGATDISYTVTETIIP